MRSDCHGLAHGQLHTQLVVMLSRVSRVGKLAIGIEKFGSGKARVKLMPLIWTDADAQLEIVQPLGE